MKKIKAILYIRNSVLNILTACVGCALKTQVLLYWFFLQSLKPFFSGWDVLCSVSVLARCRQVRHANTSNFCSCRVDFVFLFSLISTCFLLPIKYTLEPSSVTTHQQTCPSPTLCDTFIATSSNAGSPHQGSGEGREMGPAAISKQAKPPAVFLETQEPLSHKWATGTCVK